MNSPDTVASAVPVTPAVPDPASGRACDPPAPPPAGADPFAPDGHETPRRSAVNQWRKRLRPRRS